MTMNCSSYVYVCVLFCVYAEKIALVSAHLQESSADSTELHKYVKKLDVVKQLLNRNQEIIYRMDPSYFETEKRDNVIRQPTKFQMLFSTFYSRRLPFNMLFDLLKRQTESTGNSNKPTGMISLKPFIYSNDDKRTTSANGEKRSELYKPIKDIVKPKSVKDLTSNAKHEQQSYVYHDRDVEQKEDLGIVDLDANQSLDKRQYQGCDISKATLNMIVEYFKFRTICGKKAAKIRFGLGK